MNIKSLVSAVALASALAVPAVSFAQQSNGPVTRAQVRAELVQLEKAGWSPAMDMGNNPHYPDARPCRWPTGTRCTTIINALISDARAAAKSISPEHRSLSAQHPCVPH
jgi:Domain of unknown function (DUF4148)